MARKLRILFAVCTILVSWITRARAADQPASLLAAAEKKFAIIEPLKDVEVYLFGQIGLHGIADFKHQNDAEIDAIKIQWMLTDPSVQSLLSPSLQIRNVTLKGSIDISGITLKSNLLFQNCSVEGGVAFANSSIRSIQFFDCDPVNVRLYKTDVAGSVDFLGGGWQPTNSNRTVINTLFLQGVAIASDLTINHADVSHLNFTDVSIGHDFRIDGGSIFHCTIPLVDVRVKGSVFWSGIALTPQVQSTDDDSGIPSSCPTHLILADKFSVSNNLILSQARANLAVELSRSNIAGDLSIDNVALANVTGRNLFVGGTLNISKSTFKATVDLSGTHVSNDVILSGDNTFSGQAGPALLCDGLQVARSLYLLDSKCNGGVSLVNVDVANELRLVKLRLAPESDVDLRYGRCRLYRDDKSAWPSNGRLLAAGFVYDFLYEPSGKTDKDTPTFGERLQWIRLQPDSGNTPQPYSQLAKAMDAAGHTEEATKVRVGQQRDYTADLSGVAWFGHALWGFLTNYGYNPWKAFWIGIFFIALGGVLFRFAYSHGAIVPTDDDAFVSPPPRGLRPTDPAFGRMLRPTYPRFSALIFSAQMFTPVLNLFVADKWLPSAVHGPPIGSSWGFKIPLGRPARWYLWFHIISGWVITSLWVVGLTGLAKNGA